MKSEGKVQKQKVIIIGGGASGLMLKSLLPSALLLEKNSQCGLKLLITGNGSCNITHDEETGSFIGRYPGKRHFVSHSIYSFPPQRIRSYFSSLRVETYVRDDGKVFPVSRRSSDVRDALLSASSGILTDCAVSSVKKEGDSFTLETDKGTLQSEILVIATGGMTYPKTGSEGDGYVFAKGLGHAIIHPHTALSPIRIEMDTTPVEGVSIENVTLKAGKNRESGAIVFTRCGLSGPAAQNISRFLADETELTVSFLAEFRTDSIKEENGKSSIMNALHHITGLPSSLLLFLFPSLKDKNVASVTKDDMKEIEKKLTSWTLRARADRDLNRAMVTSGGVDTASINPKTMESRIVENLFFTGEVIDVDGECGGYNLTFAFASAFLAAENIRKRI